MAALAAVSHRISTAVVPKGFDQLDATRNAASGDTLDMTLRDQKNSLQTMRVSHCLHANWSPLRLKMFYVIRPSASDDVLRIDLTKPWARQVSPPPSLGDLLKAGREDVAEVLTRGTDRGPVGVVD